MTSQVPLLRGIRALVISVRAYVRYLIESTMASNNKAKISAKPSLATIIYSESVVNTSETSTGSAWLKSKWTRVVETVILTGVILLVCGLFTIPTILYALPPLLVRLIIMAVFKHIL